MNKKILALALFSLSSNIAYSEEGEPELMEAHEDYILSLLSSCETYAQEDEVSQSALQGYLLTCINDELEEAYYKPIKTLPKQDKKDGEPG